MSLYERILKREAKIALVGLGYVGLPLALAFDRKASVIGFDVDSERVRSYQSGECTPDYADRSYLLKSNIEFTSDASRIKDAAFIVIAVPTPVDSEHIPNLTPLIKASEIVGRNLSSGSIVVYESTVYPGCTESVCVPILEQESGLCFGKDFKVGYSPERINPGDDIHRVENICKIVSSCDNESLLEIEKIYQMIITAGTYAVSNIKTAEAIKIAENTQRDINIAYINELAMVFDKMHIDTNEVVDGMNTKWNALGFRPGLVGGHCISVDPYYFLYGFDLFGCQSKMIRSAREINENMGLFIADKSVDVMKQVGLDPQRATVAILGFSFKENSSDIRNSKVNDVIQRLNRYGVKVLVADPLVRADEANEKYGVDLMEVSEIHDVDCVIMAVAHDAFKSLSLDRIKRFYRKTSDTKKILIDVKGIYSVSDLNESDLHYWRL